MDIVDLLIIIFIISIGLIGFKRGVFKQGVITIGSILIFVLAYYFKDKLANFFSYNLPFFNFKGQFYGLTTINIILYQMIAFLILLAVFAAVLGVLIKISGIFEKILRLTIVLGIPSKLLGLLLGLVEGYVVVFIALFILKNPAFNLNMINNSSLTNTILNSSPGLSKIVKNTENSIIEIYELGHDYVVKQDVNEFNKNTIDIMLKNKIITKEYVNNLIDKRKIKVSGIDDVLNKY